MVPGDRKACASIQGEDTYVRLRQLCIFITRENASLARLIIWQVRVIGCGVKSLCDIICICYSTGRSDIRDIFHEL